MDQERVIVFPKELQGALGLDICIIDEEATVADLLTAIAPFSDDVAIYKTHHPEHFGSCCGCRDNCCTTSLIAPDLASICRLAEEHGVTVEQAVERFCDRRALQAGYVIFSSFPCCFLLEDRCTIYPLRPLICRLFLCTRLTEPFQDLIHAILGRGACEVAMLLSGDKDGLPIGDLPDSLGGERESQYRREFVQFYRNAIKRESGGRWQPQAYETWRLRDFCSDPDWAILTRKTNRRDSDDHIEQNSP